MNLGKNMSKSVSKSDFNAKDFARAYEVFVTNYGTRKLVNFNIAVSRKYLNYDRDFYKDFMNAKKFLKAGVMQDSSQAEELLKKSKIQEQYLPYAKDIYHDLINCGITLERLDNYLLEIRVRGFTRSKIKISSKKDEEKLTEIFKNCGLEGKH